LRNHRGEERRSLGKKERGETDRERKPNVCFPGSSVQLSGKEDLCGTVATRREVERGLKKEKKSLGYARGLVKEEQNTGTACAIKDCRDHGSTPAQIGPLSKGKKTRVSYFEGPVSELPTQKRGRAEMQDHSKGKRCSQSSTPRWGRYAD